MFVCFLSLKKKFYLIQFNFVNLPLYFDDLFYLIETTQLQFHWYDLELTLHILLQLGKNTPTLSE